ncbi:putative 3-ketoacyl-CoA thiolase/acetyl-CoA acetyltransferase [Rhodococcus sp. AW25M09]|nr:putative 3-ketoacyl-CoA thiolase/acetyl-CoA acetyltransferase [Rhodococcus sp. AW25M09]
MKSRCAICGCSPSGHVASGRASICRNAMRHDPSGALMASQSGFIGSESHSPSRRCDSNDAAETRERISERSRWPDRIWVCGPTGRHRTRGPGPPGWAPPDRAAFAKAGLTMNDIDLFEVNEAFASVVLAWAKETGADLNKVNVNDGAIAIGHPLGGSGAALTPSWRRPCASVVRYCWRTGVGSCS